MRIAIVGGGISGLSAAYQLEQARRQGAAVSYTLFEASERLGGVLQSERLDDCVVEGGPDSFLTEKPWGIDLCHELGIGDELVGSNDRARATYILVHNRLVEMPDGLMFMIPTKLLPTALTPLFSWKTKLKMLGDLRQPPRISEQDESVGDLIRRHFGEEVVDRLAAPMLSGIFGGDADQLSVKAVLPRFVEMEETFGSLCRAMLAARKKQAEMRKARGGHPRAIFTSLRGGMQQMIDAVVATLDATSLRTSCAVRQVQRLATGWELASPRGSETFDGLIFATPARIAADLLQTIEPQIAADLGQVGYSSSVTVTLSYRRQDLQHCRQGFGLLVPRSEGKRMMAATFVHVKFPSRAPQNRALVRCFFGSVGGADPLTMSEEEAIAISRRELREIVGITAEPQMTRVFRWDRAMAQYRPGHLERIERVEKRLDEIDSLALAGNFAHGIGVGDCIRMGRDAAEKLLQLGQA